MSITRRIAEQRHSLIVGQAGPYLEEREEVLQWARARAVGGRGEGFVYITDRRYIVHLGGASRSPGTFPWREVRTWGVMAEARGGPILGIETDDGPCLVQLRAVTRNMVNDVSEFIERFSELAPWPRARFDGGEDVGEFKMMRKIELPHHKPTLGESVKRIAFTVIGLVLVIGGVLIGPVPGPWSLPMILAGLAVLAQEFDWAKDLRHWLKQRSKAVASRWRQRRERAQ